METRLSWIQSVTSQFQVSSFGKLMGPAWFYLLIVGLLIGALQSLIWHITGGLVMLSGACHDPGDQTPPWRTTAPVWMVGANTEFDSNASGDCVGCERRNYGMEQF